MEEDFRFSPEPIGLEKYRRQYESHEVREKMTNDPDFKDSFIDDVHQQWIQQGKAGDIDSDKISKALNNLRKRIEHILNNPNLKWKDQVVFKRDMF